MAEIGNRQRFGAVREQLAALSAGVDLDALEGEAAALEQEMGAPGFWDDQERAAKVSAEHSRLTRRIEEFKSLVGEVEDLEGLVELAAEDDSIADELETHFTSVEDRLAALELA